MLTLSISAQNNIDYTKVDTTYFLNGELSGNWQYGVIKAAVGGYNDNRSSRVITVFPNDSISIDGQMYAIAYSKQYRNAKVVLLIDWTGKGKDFAELVLVTRKFPSTWISGMLNVPKLEERYIPEARYFELYKVNSMVR
jgi:hypothetical protein